MERVRFKVKSRENLGRKIRTLQFPIANSKGGITQYVLQNWKYIDKSKFQFDFATMSKSLDFADDLEKEGCKIYYISCYAEQDKERFTNEFREILIGGNYDVVHLHTKQWKSFLIEQIAKEVGVKKVIVHAHNTGIDTLDEKKREEEMKLHDQVREELTEDIATDFWTCSWKAAEFMFGNKIAREKICKMNNAIDVQKFKFKPEIRDKYRKGFGITDEFVIGNVGRFVYQKNQEFLLEVFKQLCFRGGNFKLLLVGNGEREKEYRDFVRENGLEEKVIFAGHRQDVNYLLQAMDCFCFPSRFEGLGIALIEAQVTGVKCICGEQVPKEAIVTECVDMLPFVQTLWVNCICNYAKEDSAKVCEKRETAWKQVNQNGYDILEQIKKVETGYVM